MVMVQNAVQYAVGKWIEKDHPKMETGHCIDIKQKTIHCGACSDICPTGATLGCRDHNWDACIDCNLCVAACPTRALRSSAMNLDKFIRALGGDAAEVTVGCEQCESDAYLQLYCMGGIPWEVFAAAALDKTLLLNIDLCENCVEKEGWAQLLKSLEKTRAFLGAEYFDKHILIKGRQQSGGYSRREAFSLIRGVGRNVTENLLNKGNGVPIDGLFYRKALAQRLENPKKTDPLFTLQTLSFNENCWACNICKNICPEHAIAIEKDKDTHEYSIVHTPWLCTSCGLCIDACKDEAIDGLFSYSTPEPLLPLATDVFPTICERCHRNFKPTGETLCTNCKKTDERKLAAEKLKAENEAKAAARKEQAAKEAAEKEAAEKSTENETDKKEQSEGASSSQSASAYKPSIRTPRTDPAKKQ